jgi:peptidoglycan/LPS O-acetylase OafA/YrhL
MNVNRPYHWLPITPKESLFLKGIAILLIVIHNFCHQVLPYPGVSEFRFSQNGADDFISFLVTQPLDMFRTISTYYGHYGVQIFLFLTGYAFMVKSLHSAPKFLSFQIQRWKALYPAIFIAALGYIAYDSFFIGIGSVIETEGINLIRQMTGISNFIPDNIYHPIGPWWFISLILQAYLVLPFILQMVQKHGEKAIWITIFISYLSQYYLQEITDHIFDLNIYHTILGHLDTIGLGLLVAYKKSFKLSPWLIAGSILFFFIASLYEPLWKYSCIALIIGFIPIARLLQRQKLLLNSFTHIGAISIYIFLCNGYLREPLIHIAKAEPHWWKTLWTCFFFLIITYCWALMMKIIVDKISLRKISADKP